MISYNFSIQGKSHIEKDTVCQDYSKVVKLNANWYLGVAADGVGSALHSEIGSNVAVETLCDYCLSNMDDYMQDYQMEELLRLGYEYAFKQVVKCADRRNDNIADYDTTLSAALYNGKKVIYGHSGDGGILARLYDGRTIPLTTRQKGADGTSVRPLRAGADSWAFGTAYDIAGVLLLTDGMLDGVFQPALLNLPPDMVSFARGDYPKDNAYITASEFFLNPYSVYKYGKVKNKEAFLKKYITGKLDTDDENRFRLCLMNAYKHMLGAEASEEIANGFTGEHIYAVLALVNVTDDKTVVGMLNEKMSGTTQDLSYYHEPDWKQKTKIYNSLLYGKVNDHTDAPTDILVAGKETTTNDGIGGTGNENGNGGSGGTSVKDQNAPESKKTGVILAVCISLLVISIIAGVIATRHILTDGKNSSSDKTTMEVSTEQDEAESYIATPGDADKNDDDIIEKEIRHDARNFVKIMTKDNVEIKYSKDSVTSNEPATIIMVVEKYDECGMLDKLKNITGYYTEYGYSDNNEINEANTSDKQTEEITKDKLLSYIMYSEEDRYYEGDEIDYFIERVKGYLDCYSDEQKKNFKNNLNNLFKVYDDENRDSSIKESYE